MTTVVASHRCIRKFIEIFADFEIVIIHTLKDSGFCRPLYQTFRYLHSPQIQHPMNPPNLRCTPPTPLVWRDWRHFCKEIIWLSLSPGNLPSGYYLPVKTAVWPGKCISGTVWGRVPDLSPAIYKFGKNGPDRSSVIPVGSCKSPNPRGRFRYCPKHC